MDSRGSALPRAGAQGDRSYLVDGQRQHMEPALGFSWRGTRPVEGFHLRPRITLRWIGALWLLATSLAVSSVAGRGQDSSLGNSGLELLDLSAATDDYTILGRLALMESPTLTDTGFTLRSSLSLAESTGGVPEGPLLNITFDGSHIVLSWSVFDFDMQLEESADLGDPGAWQPVNEAPVSDGQALSIAMVVDSQSRFFRLSLR
jgi:hypothetical protein